MFRYLEVEKNIEAAHCEIVEKAEKVDTCWHWGCEWRDIVGCIGREGEALVDDLEGSLLAGRVAQREVELSLLISLTVGGVSGRRKRRTEGDLKLFDDVVVAGEDDVVDSVSGVVCCIYGGNWVLGTVSEVDYHSGCLTEDHHHGVSRVEEVGWHYCVVDGYTVSNWVVSQIQHFYGVPGTCLDDGQSGILTESDLLSYSRSGSCSRRFTMLLSQGKSVVNPDSGPVRPDKYFCKVWSGNKISVEECRVFVEYRSSWVIHFCEIGLDI